MTSPVHRACDAAGGVDELARRIGVSSRMLFHYRNAGEWPLHRVPAVAAATGIPKAELHPAFAEEESAA